MLQIYLFAYWCTVLKASPSVHSYIFFTCACFRPIFGSIICLTAPQTIFFPQVFLMDQALQIFLCFWSCHLFSSAVFLNTKVFFKIIRYFFESPHLVLLFTAKQYFTNFLTKKWNSKSQLIKIWNRNLPI